MFTIAIFTKNRLNPAYIAARLGADRTAARLGARTIHYIPDKPDDIDEQIALIDQAVNERPDAIALVPVHPTAINASIRKINAAGIPLVGYVNRLTAGECVTYVGSEDYPLAVSIATHLFDKLDGHGDVVIVEGPADSVTSIERVRGFRDAAAKYPGVRIVGSCTGDYQREPARIAMAKLLVSTPRIDGVLAANDIMGIGAIDALEAAGQEVPLVGVNAIPQAITAIKNGRMLATVDFDAMKMGCVATEAAIRHLRGERVPKEILLPVEIVDRSNCERWDRPYEERECPKWADVVS